MEVLYTPRQVELSVATSDELAILARVNDVCASFVEQLRDEYSNSFGRATVSNTGIFLDGTATVSVLLEDMWEDVGVLHIASRVFQQYGFQISFSNLPSMAENPMRLSFAISESPQEERVPLA